MPIDDKNLRHYLYAIIALAVACLLAFILLSIAKPDAEGQAPPPVSPHDAHILELDQKALDEAYRQHLAKLFSVWVTEGAGLADRISRGLATSRRAYIEVMTQLERRERQLKERAK